MLNLFKKTSKKATDSLGNQLPTTIKINNRTSRHECSIALSIMVFLDTVHAAMRSGNSVVYSKATKTALINGQTELTHK